MHEHLLRLRVGEGPDLMVPERRSTEKDAGLPREARSWWPSPEQGQSRMARRFDENAIFEPFRFLTKTERVAQFRTCCRVLLLKVRIVQ
jgi:hypothetical protein